MQRTLRVSMLGVVLSLALVGAAAAATITVRNMASVTLPETVVFKGCTGVIATQSFGSLLPGFEQTQTRTSPIVGQCLFTQEVQTQNDFGSCSASTASLPNPAEPDEILITWTGATAAGLTCAITFPLTPPPPPPSPPLAPSFLQARSGQGNGGPFVDLTWFDNSSNETFFRLERKVGSGSFQEIAVLGADVSSHQDSAVSAGQTLTYRVRACNSAGCSSFSNQASITL